MAKEHLQTRIPTELHDWISEYADEKDISRSAAAERLLNRAKELEEAGITITIPQEASVETQDEETIRGRVAWEPIGALLLATGSILGFLAFSAGVWAGSALL